MEAQSCTDIFAETTFKGLGASLSKTKLKIIVVLTISLAAWLGTSTVNHVATFGRLNFLSSFSAPRPVIKAYAINTSTCRIPDFDPFDSSVKSFYERMQYYNCTGTTSFIEQRRNILLVDVAILHTFYNTSAKEVSCVYRNFVRDESLNDTDNLVMYSNASVLMFGVPIEFEQIRVDCKLRGNTSYTDYFLIPLVKTQVERRCSERELRKENLDIERMNIVFMGVDSVSRLNFIRHLVLTREYLFRNFQPVELFGFTKVGDNSFPNQCAMLSGTIFSDTSDVCKKGVFDNESWVWNDYSNLGYRTMHFEENPLGGIFNIYCNGFRKQPTDYYLRPLMLGIARAENPPHDWPCYRTRVETEMYLDYYTSLLALLGDRPTFAYFWMTALPHDGFNNPGYIDVPLRRAFETLTKTGVMSRSLVILLADHGMRFGDVRLTFMGRYEDRLPFSLLLFPPAFQQKYPSIMANLRVNQHRLTTAFDIHATLVELTQFPRSLSRNEFATERGLSLLHQIPENRTCADASIDQYYCCCDEFQEDDAAVKSRLAIAKFIVSTTNKWLFESAPGMCKRHTLKRVFSIRKDQSSGGRNATYYRGTIATKPANAILEGSVAVTDKGTMTLEKLARLNKYGNQSHCLKGTTMEKYCLCRDV
ncbi:uncharacterized protein LOC135385057 [Ornithodoros turicata]|uniref:uncharacterized protein LOC135385057 n=1 Tax=Ornithodoros turicata TaxID=34597 RepID=UPI003138AF03